nr:translation elongation factor Ts [Leptolyngbya sp. 'hensonii']
MAEEISPQLVKELREKTGAGMMDCKKALKESGGDIAKAGEWLRQKGLASATKKESRVAAEGLIGSYIHTGGRVGVLVEINCETDFVARREEFQSLVRDVAMQIAACPNVEYVRTDDIPPEIVAKEKEIEMGRDDLAGKPDNIKEKIVLGRIDKRLKDLALMDQPYIKDQNITVAELVKQHVAKLSENIQVRRFSRFVLGEGVEPQGDTSPKSVAPPPVPPDLPDQPTVSDSDSHTLATEAELETSEMQNLEEQLDDLQKAAIASGLQLKFKVRIELVGESRPSDDAIVKLNELLKEVSQNFDLK